MTDEATELRCADCNGVFLEGKVFYLLGSVRPSPTVTVNDEIAYEYDSGDLCQVCYKYKMELLKRPTTRYCSPFHEVPV